MSDDKKTAEKSTNKTTNNTQSATKITTLQRNTVTWLHIKDGRLHK